MAREIDVSALNAMDGQLGVLLVPEAVGAFCSVSAEVIRRDYLREDVRSSLLGSWGGMPLSAPTQNTAREAATLLAAAIALAGVPPRLEGR